jgi:hypothetical protein
MNKTSWVGLSIVAVIVVIVVILAGGGSPTSDQSDAADDVTITDGTGEPGEATLADITEASVRKDGDQIVFEVTVASDIPRRVRDGNLDFRWDVSEAGEDTWIVAANLNTGPTASVTSLRTDFGASTIDGTLPGSIELSGATLTITLDATKVDGFPTTFEWRLMSTLDGDPADPTSATATDSAPDSGVGRLD